MKSGFYIARKNYVIGDNIIPAIKRGETYYIEILRSPLLSTYAKVFNGENFIVIKKELISQLFIYFCELNNKKCLA